MKNRNLEVADSLMGGRILIIYESVYVLRADHKILRDVCFSLTKQNPVRWKNNLRCYSVFTGNSVAVTFIRVDTF